MQRLEEGKDPLRKRPVLQHKIALSKAESVGVGTFSPLPKRVHHPMKDLGISQGICQHLMRNQQVPRWSANPKAFPGDFRFPRPQTGAQKPISRKRGFWGPKPERIEDPPFQDEGKWGL